MSDKYRVGIIGCGGIANAHAHGYQGIEEVEIVALADPVEVALNQFGAPPRVSAPRWPS